MSCGNKMARYIFPIKFTFYLAFQVLLVSVCWSCYNKIQQTGWLINNRNSLLTVLEAGSLRAGCWHGQVRDLFQSKTSHCVLTGWRERASANPLHEGSTFMTQPSPGDPIFHHHLSGVGYQHMNFKGTQTFRH